MSELTQCLATPHEFTWKDKTYQVSLCTQKIKGQFEQKQFARAKEAAMILKSCMSQAEYQSHLKQLNDDYIAGSYGLESENTHKALQSIKGITTLASLLFGVAEDLMIQIIVDKRDEVLSLIKLIINESFGIVEEMVSEQVVSEDTVLR